MSEPTSPVAFSPAVLAELEAIAARYPNRRAATLPALWLAQREFGWISQAAIAHVAELLGISPAKVYETAAFYTMYQKSPPGRFHLQLCQTLSCELSGAEALREWIHRELGIRSGERTADGVFSFQAVECLAACHRAPCLQVNDDYHEDMTEEKLAELVAELRRQG